MYKKKINNASQTIMFVAGKSGGHIIPALTLARQYHAKDAALKIVFFTTDSALDRLVIERASFITHIPLKTRRSFYRLLQWFLSIYTIIELFCAGVVYMMRYRPALIISTGGFIAVPLCIAGRLCGVPVHLYELNAVPGKAIRFLSPCATAIYVCFKRAASSFNQVKTHFKQYPLQFSVRDKIAQDAALHTLKLSDRRKTILILGGSQGSLFINVMIRTVLQEQLDWHTKIQIIHQVGSADYSNIELFYQELGIPAVVFAYHHYMNTYYCAADVVICRAGAGTLFETLFFEKPMIIIPLETKTTDHQLSNAHEFAVQYPQTTTVLLQADIEQDKTIMKNALQRFLF